MDVTRRRASGTLAELVGRSALASDVRLRTFGLRRTARRTMSVLSRKTRDELRAYADGVNAWIVRNRLPGQYASVRVTEVEPWSAVDSVLVLKLLSFGLSFDLDIDRTAAVRAYDAAGFDGRTAVLGDLSPFAPFNPASPVIDATRAPVKPETRTSSASTGGSGVSQAVARMAAEYLKRAEQAPAIVEALNRGADRGSNSWVIGGRHSANGRPILASDPHLGPDSPALFSPIELEGGGFDIQGDSVAGAPYVILGQNRDIAFGATQHFMDVTDTFVERVRPDPASASGLSTVYEGRLEPVVAIEETFRVNPRTPGAPERARRGASWWRDPRTDAGRAAPQQRAARHARPGGGQGAVGAVQRLLADHRASGPSRNNRPVMTHVDRRHAASSTLEIPEGIPSGLRPCLAAPPHALTGRSLRDGPLDAFRQINVARDVDEFRAALQYFDLGGQHFIYADRKGNIAYFTNAEVPIREDLQAGKVDGNPPYLLRDGSGGNEWLAVQNPQPHQSLPYEIVPLRELPQTVNPPAGFIVSANNDPTANSFDNDVLNQARPAGGISYLSFLHNGFRAGRITDMVRAAVRTGPITAADVAHMQADDHHRRSVLHPDHHGRADPRAQQQHAGAGRARKGPAHRRGGRPARPMEPQLPDRHRRGLRRRRPRRPAQHPIPAGTRPQRGGHDLRAVARPLRRQRARQARAADLAAPVFGNSTRQSDYRWGKLHRITFSSPLGAPYTIPSQGNRRSSPLPGLPGLPVDGGSHVPDVAGHPLRADTPAKFTVPAVPNRRFLAQATPSGWRSVDSLPGGASEDLGNRFEQNLLGDWLTNDTYPLRMYPRDLVGAVDSLTRLLPKRGR